MKRSDWIILAAGLGDGDPLTPVQLQKSLFLLGELLPLVKQDGSFYEFQPYNYGPFCADIYSDAERLEQGGEMRITPSSAGGWREYAATSEGRGWPKNWRNSCQRASRAILWTWLNG